MRAWRRVDEWRGDLRGRALLVVLGGLICQMGLGFGYVLGPLAGDLIDEFGWSRGDFSTARALQLGAMAAASPVIGLLTVRYGARAVLTASTVGLSILFFGLSRLDGLAAYWLAMVLMGVALTGVGDVTVGQTVSQWVERRRGLALGVVFVGSNLGGILCVPAAVSLAERHGWRAAMLGLGIAGVLALVPAARWLVGNRSRGAAPLAGRSDADADAAGGATPTLTLREAVRTRSFAILMLSLFTFFFYQLSLLEHFVLYLTDAGMPRAEAAGWFTTAIGLGLVSKLGLGALADRLDERTAMVGVYAGLTLSSLLLLLPPGPGVVAAFVLSFGLSYPARDIVHPLVVIRCFGLGNMAAIYGALMIALVAGGLGPPFAGFVHDRTGDYTLAFGTFAALNALTLGALFFLRDERRPPA